MSIVKSPHSKHLINLIFFILHLCAQVASECCQSQQHCLMQQKSSALSSMRQLLKSRCPSAQLYTAKVYS